MRLKTLLLLTVLIASASIAAAQTPGTWAPLGNMSAERSNHTATRLNDGTVLIVGGAWRAGYGAEIWDPATGTFTLISSPDVDRRYHTATLLPDGDVLVTGGIGPYSWAEGSAERYHAASRTWSNAGAMSTARWEHTAALLTNGKVLVAGSDVLADIYDPATNSWSRAPDMPFVITRPIATALPDGRVLLAGGDTAETLVFDPAANAWSSGGAMSAPRDRATTTLLPDGRVLIAGGRDKVGSVGASRSTMEVWNGSWTAAGGMIVNRENHRATLLPSGSVLIAGGKAVAFFAVNELYHVEIYDPATGRSAEVQRLELPLNDFGLLTLQDGRVLLTGGMFDDDFNHVLYSLASASLYAEPHWITGLEIAPLNPKIGIDATKAFTATATYSDDSTKDVTSLVAWTSSDTTVATIASDGVASPLKHGTTTIAAAIDAFSASTNLKVADTLTGVIVSPAMPLVRLDQTQPFTATAVYRDGFTKDVTNEATWSSDATAIATVAAGGLATGVGFGSASITATFDNVAGHATLTVEPHLVSIDVTPATPTIKWSATQQFTATGRYNDNSTKDLTASVVWSSSAPALIPITAGGLATGAFVATATITATLDGISGNTLVTVVPKLIELLAGAPASEIPFGSTLQFTAFGTWSDGSSEWVTGDVTWTSSAPDVMTISSSGLATAVSHGEATITATYEGLSSSETKTVVKKVTAVDVTPANPEIAVGSSQAFVATARYSDGSSADVTSAAEWSSTDWNAVQPAAPAGTFYAIRAGTSTIAAEYRGFTGSTAATVLPRLVLIAVTPANPAIAAGSTIQFTATGYYTGGPGTDLTTRDLSSSVAWTSNATSIASVSAAGLATAVDVGTVTISATLGELSGSTTLNVTPSLVSIAVTPVNPHVVVGDARPFTATGTYSDGSTKDLTASVSWASSATSAATIDASGLATTVGHGTTTISATLGTVAGSSVLTVAPKLVSIVVTPESATLVVSNTLQFTATGHYSDGSTSDLTSAVEWTSTVPDLATISPTGLATAVFGGGLAVTSIYAQLGSLFDNTQLFVAPALTGIDITPSNSTVAIGGSLQLQAVGTYTDGSTKNLTVEAAWSSDDAAIAKVTGGSVSALALGKTTVRATVDGITGATPLTVTETQPLWIEASPNRANMTTGATQQFTATGVYPDESRKDLTASVTWSSSDPAVVTVNASGLATAVGPGTAYVTFSLGAAGGSIDVIVVDGAVLKSILVEPVNTTIAAGGTRQFTATGFFSDATTHDITTTVAWSSDSSAVASIDSTGMATGVAPGTATISASLGTIKGATVLTVSDPGPLVGLSIAPMNSTIAGGEKLQFTATGTFSDGSKRDVTGSAAWLSDNPGVATISGGLATGVGAGTAMIQANVGSFWAGTPLTVTKGGGGATLTGIALSPENPKIDVGATQAFSAFGYFSDGSKSDITAMVTWTSDDSAVAKIGPGGVASGAGAGTTIISAARDGVKAATSITVVGDGGGSGGGGAATLVGLTVTPENTAITVGATQQFTATGAFSDGSTKDMTSLVSWMSSDKNIAFVGPDGVALGVNPGPAFIGAFLDGVQGMAQVMVIDKPSGPALVGIAVTPVNPTVSSGATQQFTAMGAFSDGSTHDVTSTVAWTSSNTAIATITSSGLATAVGAGTTTIAATLVDVSGGTMLTVTSNGKKPAKKVTPAVIAEVHDASHAAVTSVSRGTSVHAAALVAGNALQTPTGSVTVTWFANARCNGKAMATSAPAPLASGSVDAAAFTQTPAAAGSYGFLVSYSGDVTYAAANATCAAVVVR